jgi:hypothetical protein
MTNLLKLYDLKYLGTCNCGGTRNEKYYHGLFTLYIQPKRYQFKLKKDAHTVVPLTPISELESTLQQYGFKKTVAGHVDAPAETVPH